MSATPKHVVSPALFDSIDEYVEQLKSETALSGDVVPETSPVLTFTDHAFAQFFQNEVGREITGFSYKAKVRAARLRYSRKGTLSKPAMALISLFEQFCDVREDVLGAGYGGQASVLEDFHCRLVSRLLERLVALAAVSQDSDLRLRAQSALEEFEPAVAEYDWTSA